MNTTQKIEVAKLVEARIKQYDDFNVDDECYHEQNAFKRCRDDDNAQYGAYCAAVDELSLNVVVPEQYSYEFDVFVASINEAYNTYQYKNTPATSNPFKELLS